MEQRDRNRLTGYGLLRKETVVLRFCDRACFMPPLLLVHGELQRQFQRAFSRASEHTWARTQRQQCLERRALP